MREIRIRETPSTDTFYAIKWHVSALLSLFVFTSLFKMKNHWRKFQFLKNPKFKKVLELKSLADVLKYFSLSFPGFSYKKCDLTL